MTSSRTLGVVLHPHKAVAEAVHIILEWGRVHGVRVVARERDRGRAPGTEVVPDDAFPGLVDGVVALGGDGTMLGAMRSVIDRPVPVLGVNYGNLGFLVEVSPEDLGGALARLVDGDFVLEDWSCIDVRTQDPLKVDGNAFNDVVLNRAGRAGAVSVDLTVNGQQYGYYKADALIVCTPNGSTAYNYAAGGPVLSPSTASVAVTPVAPMAGIARPVVLAMGDEIGLRVADDSGPVDLDVDGTAVSRLNPGDRVAAVLRGDAGSVVRFAPDRHSDRSRLKLSLLDLPLRRDQLLELVPEPVRRQFHRD